MPYAAPAVPGLQNLGQQPAPQQQAPNAAPQMPSAPTSEAPPDPNAPDYYQQYTRYAARQAGIDPDRFYRQIEQESGFAPDVISGKRRSSAGAVGIAQFMPDTAAGLGVDPLDPTASLMAAAKLMASNLQTFAGHQDAAEAAYNAGAGNILALTREYHDGWRSHLAEAGLSETQRYLDAIDGTGSASASASGSAGGPGYTSPPIGSGRATAMADSQQPPAPGSANAGAGGEETIDGLPVFGPPTPTAEQAFGAEQAALGHSGPATQREIAGNASPDTGQWDPLGQDSIPGKVDAGILKAAGLPAEAVGKALDASPVPVPDPLRTFLTSIPYFLIGPEGELADASAASAKRIAIGSAGVTAGDVAGKSVGAPPLVGQLVGGYFGAKAAGHRIVPVAKVAAGLDAIQQAIGRALVPEEVRLARGFFAGVIPGDQLPEDIGKAIREASTEPAQASEPAKPLPGADEPAIGPGLGQTAAPIGPVDFNVPRTDTSYWGRVIADLSHDPRNITSDEFKGPLKAVHDYLDQGPGDSFGEARRVAVARATDRGNIARGGPGESSKRINDAVVRSQIGQTVSPETPASSLKTPETSLAKPPLVGDVTLGRETAAPAAAAGGSAGAPPEGPKPPAFDENGYPLPRGGGLSVAEHAKLKLLTEVQMADTLPAESEALRAQVRSQRAAQAYSEVQSGSGSAEDVAARARNAVFQRGEMPRAAWKPPEFNFSPEERDALFQTINDAQERIGPYAHANAFEATNKVLQGRFNELQPNEFRLLGDVFGPELRDAVRSRADEIVGPQRLSDRIYDAGRRVGNNLTDLVFQVPRSALTYAHAPVLRQGLGFALTHPSVLRASLANWFTAVARPSNLAALRESLNESPWVKGEFDVTGRNPASEQEILGIRAQDFITPGQAPNQTMVRTLMQKIPGMERSQQSAVMYLDSLRKLGYAQEAQRLWDSGVRDPREYKGLWDTISDATGHGSRSPAATTNPMFSWQAFTGRFKSLVDPIVQPGSLNPLGPGARSVAIRNLMGVAGFGTTVLLLGELTGAGNVNWNINGPAGLKLKIGYSTIDPYAGYGSVVKLFTKAGQTLYDNKGDESRSLPALRQQLTGFARGQLGPVPDQAVNLLAGNEYEGGPKYNLGDQVRSGKLAVNLFVPIAAKSIYDAYKAHGLAGIAIGAPSLGAMGVNTGATATDRHNAAVQELITSGKLPNVPAGAKYSDLGAGEQNAVNEQLKKTNPELFGPNGKMLATTTGPIADAQNARAASDVMYKEKFDAQYKALLSGSLDSHPQDPRTIDTLVTGFRDQRRGADNEIYGNPDYQRAIAGLPQNDIRKQEADYFNIVNQHSLADGSVDWKAVDEDQAAFLSAHDQRFRDDVAALPSSADLSPILKLKQEVDAVSKPYYAIKDAEDEAKAGDKKYVGQTQAQYLAAHPDVNVARWLYSGEGLRSAAAVDLALHKNGGNMPNVAQALSDPSFKRPVDVAGLARPVNESQQTQLAWAESGKAVAGFLFNYTDNARKSITAAEFGKNVTFDQLGPKSRQWVTDRVDLARNQTLDDNPRLNAWLAWWGESSGSVQAGTLVDRKLRTDAAGAALKAILGKYGSTPPYKGFKSYDFVANPQ